MTNKQQPGDRCQVVTAHGTWLNATIISTREGHGGALVRVDGWSADVWAKPSEIRQILRVIPEPDPHDTAYQGEVGDHQPRVTETVAKYGHVATDDAVDVFAGGHIHPTYAAGVTPHFTIHADGRVQQNLAIRDDFSEVTLLADKLAPLGVSYDGQRKFIDAMAEFAKCGVTPEQVMEYVDAFARLIVTGITPRQLHDFAYQTMIDRTGHPDEGLHHITREYRGAK